MSRSWTVYDFLLLWFGGQLGSALLVAFASREADTLVVFSLAGLYLGYVVVFLALSRIKDFGELGLKVEGGDFVYIGLGVVIQIAFQLAMLPISNLLFPEGRPPQQLVEVIVNSDTRLLQLSLVVATVVLGPIFEELLYRGVLLQGLARGGKALAITVSAVVFAAVHVTGLPRESLWRSAAVFLPPLFILGLLLAWLTLRTGRLGPAIFLHSGHNLLAAFVLLIPIEVLEQLG